MPSTGGGLSEACMSTVTTQDGYQVAKEQTKWHLNVAILLAPLQHDTRSVLLELSWMLIPGLALSSCLEVSLLEQPAVHALCPDYFRG